MPNYERSIDISYETYIFQLHKFMLSKPTSHDEYNFPGWIRPSTKPSPPQPIAIHITLLVTGAERALSLEGQAGTDGLADARKEAPVIA